MKTNWKTIGQYYDFVAVINYQGIEYTLRAEQMKPRLWWGCVYGGADDCHLHAATEKGIKRKVSICFKKLTKNV
jgi:hypothetical protein